ncbi:NYN domain-containing protein [Cellulomonas triticagri]|uniref:NYN domain-containing protein n=1 Tax=Cellulomonas triticagri TaxID=2483352 RepID=A0A3M2J3V7_9CELL|nr:NYN domain-containing protein [Cellulomonas triticagri]RMI08767.1 NYN domain-containing protein [Cellulomonas triticagri]
MTSDLALDRPDPRRLRAAMFVDFDNVYIGLRRLDPEAAEAFATDPGHWLAELEAGSDADGEFTRRFLVRACYLNPSVFSRYRPNFTRAGFQVVDCPSLTQQGKSSADINLVLDAVDALGADTRYDEFVIVSADADFTPLAQRCRAADRRVTIITASPAASAYRAVADTVITANDLAELVTGGDGGATDALLAEGTESADPAEGTDDTRSSRGGRGGAGGRGEAGGAEAAGPERDGRGSDSGDGAGTTGGTGRSGGTAGRSDAATTREATAPSGTSTPGSLAARRAVLQRVRSADRPVPTGTVAQAAQKADPTLPTTRWAGTGGFLPWLAQAVPELGVAARPSPGYVWDPKRFGEADLPGAAATGPDTDATALQRQVISVTDTPGLSRDNYRVLHTALAEDVQAHPFERAATARRVRDACQEAGAAVGKASVNAVINGVLYVGLELDESVTAEDVAEAWADNVVGLCRGARMELTEADEAAIDDWVGGGLLEALDD